MGGKIIMVVLFYIFSTVSILLTIKFLLNICCAKGWGCLWIVTRLILILITAYGAYRCYNTKSFTDFRYRKIVEHSTVSEKELQKFLIDYPQYKDNLLEWTLND